MPLDRTHQHISSDIIRADAVHTPIDPSGGGSISATDGTTTVDPATSIRFPAGTLAEDGVGVAVLGVPIIRAVVTADGNQIVPGSDAFTKITLSPVYDPDGYWQTVLPGSGAGPGFIVPVGNGGIHRVTLVCGVIGVSSVASSPWREKARIGFLNLGDAGDTRAFASGDVSVAERHALIAMFTGQMDDGEEMYFYFRQDSGTDNTGLTAATHAVIERISS